jgi:hypothetical protein
LKRKKDRRLLPVVWSQNVKSVDIEQPEDVLASGFASVPQVRHVLVENAAGPLIVWIAADNPEPAVRRRILSEGIGRYEAFPETDFDLNLIPAMNGTASEIAAQARVVYSRPG